MTTSTKHCWALHCSARSACKVQHGIGKDRLVVPLCNRHFGQWPEVCLKPLAERGLGPTARRKPLSRMHLKTEGLAPMTAASTAFIITAPPKAEELYTSGSGCRVAGCDNATRTRGLCANHYRQALRRDLVDQWGAPSKGQGGWPNQKPGIRIEAPPKPGQRDPSKTACIVVGCDKDQKNRGLCSKHYTQAHRDCLLEEWGLPKKGPGGRPLETPAASSAEEAESESAATDVPGWPRTSTSYVDLLSLVDVWVTVQDVESWSDEQRSEAERWASAMLDLASAEVGVGGIGAVPPAFLPARGVGRPTRCHPAIPAPPVHPEDQLDADRLREKLDAEADKVNAQLNQLNAKAAGLATRKRALRTAQCLRELIRVDDFETMPLWMQDIFDHQLAVARHRIEEELLQAAAYGPRPARGGAA